MNITEKIIADHCGKEIVKPDELVTVKLDGVLANDVSGPIAIREFKDMGFEKIFDKDRTYLINDHFAPNCNINAATQSKVVRDFALEYDVNHFYDVGRMGIEHALLPEKGLALPGELIVGGDSHTCTYGALGAFSTGMGSTDISVAMGTGEIWMKVPGALKFEFNGRLPRFITGKDLILFAIGQIGVSGALYKTMEFDGEAITDLSMDSRFTMCNMVIEAGAKNGIIAPDEKTIEYVDVYNQQGRSYKIFKSDSNDDYEKIYRWDVSGLEPMVACPHLPENTKAVGDLKNIKLDQVIIGSCTNGRMEDLKAAAEVFRKNKVNAHIRVIVIPATQAIYAQAIKEGLIDTFIEAGVAISTPTCGPCFGGHMGILAAGEKAISTTNRNFVGRMGHQDSEVYLSGAYVAAASAVAGEIVHPKEVM